MNGAVWMLIGLIGGATVLGLGLYLYFLLKVVEGLTGQLRSLISTLMPIFSSEDVLRGFKAFHLLAQQGEQIGRKIEGLDDTIKMFYSYTFKKPVPGMPATSEESIVSGYDEEDFASREAARKLRKQGVETEESRVSVATSEIPSSNTNVF